MNPDGDPKLQEAISATEQRYRLLVETVKDYAIIMLDPGGHVATWNAGAERIKGYKANEIIGQHFSIFYPPDAIAQGKPQEEIRAATAEGRVEEEGWRLRKDDSRFWASVVLTALRDEGGQLVGFAKVTRDLTERARPRNRLANWCGHKRPKPPLRPPRAARTNTWRCWPMSCAIPWRRC